MHPHIADFLATDRIDARLDEARRARLARIADRSVPQRSSRRERFTGALRRRSDRRALGAAARHA